ncbi:sigma factor-like helix-turn-helix DNA-binding protein [Onishia taeanensis]|uniref:sigma factor-like helix-turn-helix DNA-binding protein n=1 Tax=Onishia taeanensis TaxID=284577 RepID=UPI001113CA0A|nr:sigma factor-like helix-turn-helix DNA-binding protein [Halomonas taeanensis]
MARPMNKVPSVRTHDVTEQLGELTQKLADNPNVTEFSIQVNKKTGIISRNMQHVDGRVQHDEWVTKGLSQSSRFDPREITIDDRNEAVLALLNQGLTQVEVAKRVGISQSRVAQIKKQMME